MAGYRLKKIKMKNKLFEKCNIIIFSLCIFLISLNANSQSNYKELCDLTVGKFLIDKNIKITNDTLNILVNVNKKGFCFATDIILNKEINKYQNVKRSFSANNNWITNDSIIEKKLKYDEFQSFVNYFSHRGRNHRYDNYVSHNTIGNTDYTIIDSENEIAFLVETNDYENLLYNLNDSNGLSVEENIIEFDNISDAIKFLKSESILIKGQDLYNLDKSEKDKILAKRATPINSIELPYKLKFDIDEIELDNILKELFKKFEKLNIVYDSSFLPNKEKGKIKSNSEELLFIKSFSYTMKDEFKSVLEIIVKFYNGKSYSYSFSHRNQYGDNIELNNKLEILITNLIDNYAGLLNGGNIGGGYSNDLLSIWINDTELKISKLVEEKTTKVENEKSKQKNSIGDKM
jgi:hypothetical protein